MSNLNLKNFELNETFDTNIFEYSTNLNYDTTFLEIEAISTNPNANITISGNGNLTYGSNLIKITVVSEDNLSTKTYEINAKKPLMEVEKKEKSLFVPVIIILSIIIIAFGIGFILYNKNKSNIEKNFYN